MGPKKIQIWKNLWKTPINWEERIIAKHSNWYCVDTKMSSTVNTQRRKSLSRSHESVVTSYNEMQLTTSNLKHYISILNDPASNWVSTLHARHQLAHKHKNCTIYRLLLGLHYKQLPPSPAFLNFSRRSNR